MKIIHERKEKGEDEERRRAQELGTKSQIKRQWNIHIKPAQRE